MKPICENPCAGQWPFPAKKIRPSRTILKHFFIGPRRENWTWSHYPLVSTGTGCHSMSSQSSPWPSVGPNRANACLIVPKKSAAYEPVLEKTRRCLGIFTLPSNLAILRGHSVKFQAVKSAQKPRRSPSHGVAVTTDQTMINLVNDNQTSAPAAKLYGNTAI
jgi:hypothetical protein